MKSSVNITINISPSAPPDLVVDASGVPTSGQVGQSFSGALKVSGGNPPYGFSLAPTNADGSPSALPDGVSLLSDGSFSGTPTNPGAFQFTVDVTDANG